MLKLLWYGLLAAPILFLSGRCARFIRLPVLTGYIVTGILLGPRVLASLSGPESQLLTLIEQMSIALIAVAAGAELQVAELRRTRRQVLALTASILLATWVVVFPLALVLAPQIFKGAALSSGQVIALASMAAVLMGSRSPAAALAVLRETNAKGPFASLTLAVIVVKDITVVVLFAFNLDYLRAATKVATGEVQSGGASTVAMLLPLWHVALGAAVGYGATFALEPMLTATQAGAQIARSYGGRPMPRIMEGLAAGIKWARSQARWRIMQAHQHHDSGDLGAFAPAQVMGSPGAGLPNTNGGMAPLATASFSMGERGHSSELFEGVRLGLVPLLCLVLWRVAALLHAESLVACVVVGLVVSNRSERLRAEMEHVLGQVLPVVFVAFFGIMGAHQSVASLMDIMWIAGLIFAVRLAAIWGGTLMGYGVGQAPPEQKRYAWMAYVTQAGLEIGLASTVGEEFGDWGKRFSTVMVATILLNLVSGSPFYKRSLALAGESQVVGKRITPVQSGQWLGDGHLQPTGAGVVVTGTTKTNGLVGHRESHSGGEDNI